MLSDDTNSIVPKSTACFEHCPAVKPNPLTVFSAVIDFIFWQCF